MAVAWQDARHELRLVKHEPDPDYDGTPIDQGSRRRKGGFVILPAEFRDLAPTTDIGDGKKPVPKGAIVGVYMELAKYAGDANVVYPSITRLAEDTGWSEDYMHRVLIALEMLNLIGIDRHSRGRTKRAHSYTLVHHGGIPAVSGHYNGNTRSQRVQYPLTAVSNTRSQRVEQEPVELEPVNKTPPFPPSEPKPARRKPETPWPSEFTVEGEPLAYALDKGMSEARARLQFERLGNWAQEKDIRSRDWPMRWRNWVLKDIQDSPPAPASVSRSTVLPGGIEVVPGERVEQIGPASWNLHGRDGRVRKVRPEYHGVVWDERQHINDGAAAFYAAVAVARERQEGTR